MEIVKSLFQATLTIEEANRIQVQKPRDWDKIVDLSNGASGLENAAGWRLDLPMGQLGWFLGICAQVQPPITSLFVK